MPLTWPEALQALLPTAAKRMLDKQRAKFEKDWALVSAAFPIQDKDKDKAKARAKGDSGGAPQAECTRDEYLYAWLLVNTRTFYFVTPKTEKLPKEDHMVLQPVADLFNHTDRHGCHVAFDHAGSFTFTATRAYEKGEEVHISYGRHSNDFLLVEYGFVLARNEWDEACLDDAVLPALSRRQREEVDDAGFLGNYVLDRDTVCHRTQVAVRILAVDSGRRGGGLTMGKWHRFVKGLDDGEGSQAEVDALLVDLLGDYEDTIKSKVRDLKKWKVGDEDGAEDINESRRELLLGRWDQIRKLVRATIERLEGGDA